MLRDENHPTRLKVSKGADGASQPREKGSIEDIRAQFFYRASGALSDNVAPPVQGEGMQLERCLYAGA